jgi:hypothetical protein
MPEVLRQTDTAKWVEGQCYLPNQGYMRRVPGDADGSVAVKVLRKGVSPIWDVCTSHNT